MIGKAKLFLHLHFREIKSVREVARALNIPYDALRKAFKEQTGISLIQYLEILRMNDFITALQGNGKLIISAVPAFYATSEYGIKRFTKFFGISPTQFCQKWTEVGKPEEKEKAPGSFREEKKQ